MNVPQLTLRSLLVHPTITLTDGTEERMASATGFIVMHNLQPYLITNWHVVSGRDVGNGKPLADHGGLPDKIEIWHNHEAPRGFYAWTPVTEKLVDPESAPRWLEHPRFGRGVDVVALPLSVTTNVAFLPHSLEDHKSPDGRALAADVPDVVNIIGFPFGESATAKMAIWVKGSIATPVDIDYGERPCFLIDSRTRRGQSGSPVVAYKGATDNARYIGGGIELGGEVKSRLMGVYSGRINGESDLGLVWKAPAVKEILELGIPGNRDFISPIKTEEENIEPTAGEVLIVFLGQEL
jgi:hypothetical protein